MIPGIEAYCDLQTKKAKFTSLCLENSTPGTLQSTYNQVLTTQSNL